MAQHSVRRHKHLQFCCWLQQRARRLFVGRRSVPPGVEPQQEPRTERGA